MTKLKQFWSWLKRSFVKILIGLGIVGIGIAASISTNPILMPAVDVNGEQINFAYTDDNSNEDLIIYTDKEVYGGWNGADVYFAIDNKSKAQTIDLQMFFGEESRKMTNLSRLVQDAEYTYEEPIYKEVCEDKIIVSSSTLATSTEAVCYQEQSGTETLTATKDIWSSTTLTPFSKADRISKLAKITPKSIRDFTAENKGILYIPKGLSYFKARIEFPNKANEEFFIEAIGEDSYGHLDPWYNSDWTYKKKITIASSSVDGNLTNYPVYLDLSDFGADFFSNVKDDFSDIRITSSTETGTLYHELVSASTTAQTGEMHFNSVSMSSTTDNEFYIYYGNAVASDVSTSSAWNSHYKAVYHDGGGIDSTSYSLDLTSYGGVSAGDVTGKLGKGTNYDGGNDWYRGESAAITGYPHTMQAWAKISSAGETGSVVWVGDASSGSDYSMLFVRPSNGLALKADRNTTNYQAEGTTNINDSFAMLHGVSNASDHREIFVNDSSEGTNTGSISLENFDRTTIGRLDDTNAALYSTGIIDEVRILDSELSANWISTEYANQNSPSTFYGVGSQEEEEVAVSAPIPQVISY